MRRREFLSVVGSMAMAWSFAARGLRAQPMKRPTIGMLALGAPNPQPTVHRVLQALNDLGYRDGDNIRLEFRSAGEQTSALPGLAAELVRLKVNIILAYQTPAAIAAKKATGEIPIVMIGVGDPLGTGLIASLSRPGGNITGTAGFGSELGAKTVELIRDVLPSAHRIGVLVTIGDPFTKPFLAYTELGGKKIGIEIYPIMLQSSSDYDAAFEEMQSKQVDAVIVQPTLVRPQVAKLALMRRLPSFSLSRIFPAAGGLISYSGKQDDIVRQSILYVDRILKGGNPADLPVAQPSTFEMVINLKTAKALGLNMPPTLLARADEVIE